MSPKSSFSVIAEGKYDMHILPLGEHILVSGPPRIATLEGDNLRLSESLTKGLAQVTGPLAYVTASPGRFPEAAWLTVATSNGRTGFGLRYRWQQEQWKQVGPITQQIDLGVSEWIGKRLLSFKVSGGLFGPSGFEIIDGPATALPRIQKLPGANEYCERGFEANYFHAFRSGEVFLIGTTCAHRGDGGAEGDGRPIVQRWAANSRAALVEELPLLPGTSKAGVVADFHAVSPKEVWLALHAETNTSYLANFDGVTWTAAPSPTSLPIVALSGLSDGSLWLVGATTGEVPRPDGRLEERRLSEVWHKPAGSTWRKEPLPWPLGSKRKPTAAWSIGNVIARAPGDVWLEGRYCDGTQERKRFNGPTALEPTECRFGVLRSVPSPEPLVQFPEPDYEGEPFSIRRATPLVGACLDAVFVVLYRLARSAPADYDFPVTRAALKGHMELAEAELSFVETEEEGRRYFGAITLDVGWARTLAALIEKGVPGAKPQVLCGQPRVLRRFDFDFATGAIKKIETVSPTR